MVLILGFELINFLNEVLIYSLYIHYRPRNSSLKSVKVTTLLPFRIH